MKTLLEVLQAGTDYLARQGCDEARATMQHLLAHVLHCNRTALYSQFDRPVEEAELAPLRELLKRRAAGEPLQHLLGVTEFFRRDFLTDARALIPRPETEELVEMVLKKIPDHPVRILDMGTGSGVIGVTLALELKERAGEVVLADISPQALDLALEMPCGWEPESPPSRRICSPTFPRKKRIRMRRMPILLRREEKGKTGGTCSLTLSWPICHTLQRGKNLPRKS